MTRPQDLERFYSILGELGDRVGGPRRLADCEGSMGWPERGVYFFFEAGELRENDHDLRVVRVGTHALTSKSLAILWRRLSQHKGTVRGPHAGGGHHRGSIFRAHVGAALLNTGTYPREVRISWGAGSTAKGAVRDSEYALEGDVSAYIGKMPFLWVGVPDPPGPASARGTIEAGSIALLSNIHPPPIDPPSADWLGRHADSVDVRQSGLWNVDHVRDQYGPAFLDLFVAHVRKMGR